MISFTLWPLYPWERALLSQVSILKAEWSVYIEDRKAILNGMIVFNVIYMRILKILYLCHIFE
jgi:hypothetical protein